MEKRVYVVKPDYKQLVGCIENYGILSPLVILKDGTIIDGYHRWVIANELGIKNVPVTVVKANKVEAMLLHIDLNRYRGVVVAKFLSRPNKKNLSIWKVFRQQTKKEVRDDSE